MTTITKTVDSKGRLTLGRKFASRLVIVREMDDGLLEIVRAEAVPEREAWLLKNKAAMEMVRNGMKQASLGQLVEGPDLESGSKLVRKIEQSGRRRRAGKRL